jgi:hypothetical protein
LETTTRIWEIERPKGAWRELVVPTVPVILHGVGPVTVAIAVVTVPSIVPATALVHFDAAKRPAVDPTVVVAPAVIVHDHRTVALVAPPSVRAAARGVETLDYDD